MKPVIFLIIMFGVFKNTTAQIDTTKQSGELKILSWNIYMLPAVANLSKSIAKSNKKERVNQIVDIMNASDYDIIVFQEAFHIPSRKKLANELDAAFPYQYGPLNKGFIKTNSGIFIVSKIPLQQLAKIQFKDCNSSDCFARKGSGIFEGQIDGKTFQIVGTHLNSTRQQEIRELQYEQLFGELLKPYQKEGVVQIICGDLNTKKSKLENYSSMLKKLDAIDIKTRGKRKHTYVNSKATIDYILLRKNGANVKIIDKKIRKFEAQTEMIDILNGSLSDHLAVELIIQL